MRRSTNADAERRERLAEAAAVEKAVQEAVREALLDHKRAGNPVATWKDGRVVWIPPEEIPVDEEPA